MESEQNSTDQAVGELHSKNHTTGLYIYYWRSTTIKSSPMHDNSKNLPTYMGNKKTNTEAFRHMRIGNQCYPSVRKIWPFDISIESVQGWPTRLELGGCIILVLANLISVAIVLIGEIQKMKHFLIITFYVFATIMQIVIFNVCFLNVM